MDTRQPSQTQTLPPVTMGQLSGGRTRVAALVTPLVGRMVGQDVRLDCRNLVAGTAAAADELVAQVLSGGGAARLVVEYAGDEFAGHLKAAAARRGVAGRVAYL